MKFLKRFWWVFLIVLVVLGGGYIYLQYRQMQQFQSAVAAMQTVRVTKGSIATTVGATGSVRASQSAVVNWTLEGQVGSVLVEEGDTVKTGQIIASLSTSNLPDNVVKAQTQLTTDQQALEDLKASQVDLASAQQAISTAQNALTKAKQKRAWLDSPTRGDQVSITAAQASYDLAKQEYDHLKESYNKVSRLDPSDLKRINSAIALQQAQTQLDKTWREFNYLKGKPTDEEIATAQAAVDLAQAQYDDAVRAYERFKNGPTAAEISAAEARVAADQGVIDSVNLKAPFDGVVTEVNAYAGESVSAGDAVVRIDDLSKVYIDLTVSEVDINSIQVGQAAEITFDAIPGKAYTGKIVEVGVVGSSSSGSVNFPVTVQITDADPSVKTGMTASATITTSTLEDILLVQTKSIQTANNQKTVFLVRGGQPRPVAVQTGATSDSLTQIVSGSLQEGDQVLANPSTLTTAANRPAGFFLFGLLGGGPPPEGGPGGAGGPPSGGPAGGGGPPSTGPNGGAGGAPGG
ncbi:MAG TPA: efflux RND transporter periplasmic adaptor subunit [Anaerolineaceae bacterium]|nr:efflux RND transporter periplasmic adaptor subunit [Anaerolineaceae bacterium]